MGTGVFVVNESEYKATKTFAAAFTIYICN